MADDRRGPGLVPDGGLDPDDDAVPDGETVPGDDAVPDGGTTYDDTDPGIVAAGAYAPRLRVTAAELDEALGGGGARGIDRTAVPEVDEDALTMGVAAARRALWAREHPARYLTDGRAAPTDGREVRGPDTDSDGAGDAHRDADRPADWPDATDVEYLAFATTTPPVEEGDPTVHLRAALGLPGDVRRETFAGSPDAGAVALRAAFAAVGGHGDARDADAGGAGPAATAPPATDAPKTALVVAADCPRGDPDGERERAAGAGAAALLLAPGGPVRLRGTATAGDPTPGVRFRRAGSRTVEGLGVTAYDRAAFAGTLSAAADRLGEDEDGAGDADGESRAPTAVAVQSPDGDLPYRAAEPLGVDAEAIGAASTVESLGDTGAASVPLGVARALDEGHDRVLAAGYGGEGSAVLLSLSARSAVPVAFDAALGDREGDTDGDPDDAADSGGDGESGDADGDDGSGGGESGPGPTRKLSYGEYARRRGQVAGADPEGGGAYVPVPDWRDSIPTRYRLAAGRCRACGAVRAPARGACRACHERAGYEDARLAPRGVVRAVSTVSGGGPPEFAAFAARVGEYDTAIVRLPVAGGGGESGPGDGDGSGDGARLPLLVTDADPGTPSVGDPVRVAFRRIYEQEGVVRYGSKVVPVE